MKRFTETEKWRDPWFRKLTAGAKLAFGYITDTCDAAGVWDADKELADFCIGMVVPWDKVLELFGDRVRVLPSGKWHMVKFVEFQCGQLSSECKPHLAVIRLLKKHGIDRGLKEYAKGINTLEEKEKEKEKEEGMQGGKKIPTLVEAKKYGVELGMDEGDIEGWFDHFQSNGWRVSGKTPMRDWRAALRNGKRNGKSWKNGSEHEETKWM